MGRLRWRGIKRIRRRVVEEMLTVKPDFTWDAIRVMLGHPEPEMKLLDTLCKPDRVSVDVGANYGGYVHYLLKYSSGCVAFEPVERLAAILRRGYGSRLQLEQVALSSGDGLAELRVPKGEVAYSTIEPTNSLSEKVENPHLIESHTVPTRTLDSFQLSPGFIKIDVEGHELDVLQGARETIARTLPPVLVESEERHRSGSVAAVRSELSLVGYRGYFLLGLKLHPIESFSVERNQNSHLPEGYVRNFIYVQGDDRERLLQRFPEYK